MRYQILVKKGRKIVERHQSDDYDQAMRIFDVLEENIDSSKYGIEFQDTRPFAR